MAKPIEARSLLPLLPYLIVLAGEYPEPIRASDLAKKTSRTKAAITKVRDRLLQVCDINEMAFEKGFRLSPTFDVFLSLLLVFSANGGQEKFLGSRYARLFLKGDRVHAALVTQIPQYSDYFTNEETSFMMDKILEVISSIRQNDLRQFATSIIKGSAEDIGFVFTKFMPKLLGGLELTIKDEHELFLAISVRDKLFLAVRDLVWSMVENMSILGTINERDRERYRTVYKHTIDYYLTRFFEALNTPIFAAAKTSSIPLKPSFAIIGSSRLQEAPHEQTIRRR